MQDTRAKLGPFTIIKRLGEGAHGTTFVVKQGRQKTERALKLLHRLDAAEVPQLPEGRLQGLEHDLEPFGIEHPNLVLPGKAGVIEWDGAGAPGQVLYLLSDFVDGPDLYRFTARAAWSTILEVFVSVLRGLEALHSHGLRHGHLCSSNVIVFGQGPRKSARLLDPGLSLEIAETRRIGAQTSFAPEVLRGEPGDRRSDLYDLGCLLFECATRSPLFAAEDDELTHAHLHEAPRDARELKRSVPVAVEKLIASLLHKDPAERPPSANAVIRELNRNANKRFSTETRDVRMASLLAPRFHGREAILSDVEAGLRSGDDEPKQSPVVVVNGELGQGRTRLLTELRRRLTSDGELTWIQPSRGTLEALLEEVAELEFAEPSPLAGEAPFLRRLVPGLSESFAEAAATLDNQAERQRVIEAATRVLLEAGRRGPLVVAIDDAQDAAPLLIDTLRLVARDLRQARNKPRSAEDDEPGALPQPPRDADLLVVLTLAPEELYGRPAEAPLKALQATAGVRSISLAAFDREDLCALLASAIGRELQEVRALVEQVAEASGGNPSHAMAVLADLAERDALSPPDGAWSVDDAKLQAALSEPGPAKVLTRRAESLTHLARKLLASLVLAGGRSDVPLLAEALGLTETQILGAARELERRHLVERPAGPTGHERLNVAGQSLAEALLPGLPEETARERNRDLGLAAVRLAEPVVERAVTAARHLLASDQAAQGIPFALYAARQAMDACQPEQVVDLLEPAFRALDDGARNLDDRLPEPVRRALGQDARVTAHLLSAEALQSLRRSGPARSAAQKAFSAAREARLPRAMVQALLVSCDCSLSLGDANQAKTAAEEAVDLARGGEWTKGLGLALHRRGRAERGAGDREEALASLEEARAVFAARGDGPELADLLRDVAELRAARGDGVGALDALDQALELEEEGDRTSAVARTQLVRARLQLAGGELERAQATAERATIQALEVLDTVGTASGLSCLAQVIQARGELTAAQTHQEAALALWERIGDVGGAAASQLALGRVLAESGQLDAAEKQLGAAAQAFRQLGDKGRSAEVVVALAEAYLSRGDLSRARDAVDRAQEEARAAGAQESLFSARCLRARLALLQGDLAGAEELAASTAEEAARQGLTTSECAARITLGLTRLCRGRPVEAERELRDAFDLARDRGQSTLVARARLAIARVHLIRGEPSGALGEAGKARDLAHKLEDRLLEVESLLGLGRLHLFLGQGDRACTLLDMAIKQIDAGKLGLADPAARTLRASAEQAKTQPDLEAADQLLDTAEKAAQSAARRGLRSEIDCVRASLRLMRGDASGARERAESALETSKITGNRLVAVRAEQIIARARRSQGRHEEALAAAERALEAAEAIRDGEARASALLERGRARQQLGQTLLAAHDLREATSHLRGIWASLPEDLRGDYQAKPLAQEIISAATEITAEAELKVQVATEAGQAAAAAAAQEAPPSAEGAAAPAPAVQEGASLETLRDPLTNLYNHTFFTAQLETEIKRGQRHSRPLALLKINIDRFKLVRELYGPKTAKKIIRDVAGILLRHVRDVDIVARYFGDEFELLLPDTDQRGALLTGERIREAVEAHRFEHDDEKIELTLTIGVAVFPRDAKDRDALICRVDEALYNARNRGSNTIFSFGGESEEPVEETSAELRELDQLMLSREGRTILSMVQRLVNQELNMERVIELVSGMIVEATRGERGFIMLKGPTGEFSFRHGRNMDDKVIGAPELEISNSIAKDVAETGQAVMVSEALEDDRFRDFKSVMDLNLRSILCAPIKVGDDVLGVIYVDHNQVARRFTQEDLNFLVAIANKVSIPIKNSKKLRETEDRLAAAEARLKSQSADLQTKYSYDSIVGRSEPMQRVFKLLDRIVETNHSVVIHGESGTGKELIARAIHYNGPRKAKPFVAENCAALSDTLLEAELFGHVKGAFTGADRDSKGLFELANGGTLFLDEIGDMSERMQKKLLRVLQEGEVRPVGGKRVFHVDVRIVSASNKDLKKLVQERKFREDLYYRLNVITVNLPPLRERRDDVVLLTEFFLTQHREAGAKRDIDRETLGYMMNYDWPGNVRELENEVNRLVAMSDDAVSPDLLSPKIREGAKSSSKTSDGLAKYYDRSLKDVEHEFMRDIILHTLERTNWHRTKAAKILKVPTSTLFNKMKKYGIG